MKPSILLSLAFRLIVASAHLLPRAIPTDECSDPVPNTCSFYPDCLESRFHCGPSGYPIGYGLNYCDKFSAARSKMSAAGQTWVTNTMLCLQRDLVIYGDGSQTTTCSALKDYAFGTHPDCYVKSGVCLLPPTDWKIITDTVGFNQLFDDADAIKATLLAAVECADFYLWIISMGLLLVS
jgi:hypothetical protein